MTICERCPDYPCSTLCPRAERYVAQDHVPQRETPCPEAPRDPIPVSLEEIQSCNAEGCLNFPFLSKLQNKLLHGFYYEGKTYRELAFQFSGKGNGERLSICRVRYELYRARLKISNFSSKGKETRA